MRQGLLLPLFLAPLVLALQEQQPWFQAAAAGDVADLSQRLQDGEDIHSRSQKQIGTTSIGSAWTALMFASSLGCVEAVRYILQQGAKVDLTDVNGNTALHMVADTSDDAELVTLLLAAGASTTARNQYDYTPFDTPSIQQRNSEYRPGYTPGQVASFAQRAPAGDIQYTAIANAIP